MTWNPSRVLQQRRERKARERALAEAQKAAAWAEADERTRAARDWLLSYVESHADWLRNLDPEFFPEATLIPVWRAAAPRVREMYPTDPLIKRLVALDDKGIGARMHGVDVTWVSSPTQALEAIILHGEKYWGQLPPGAEGEVPAWGYWGEDGKAVPLSHIEKERAKRAGSTG